VQEPSMPREEFWPSLALSPRSRHFLLIASGGLK
jgi:hypothetical protein